MELAMGILALLLAFGCAALSFQYMFKLKGYMLLVMMMVSQYIGLVWLGWYGI